MELKSAEQYYLHLLEIRMPWRQSNFKHEDGTYESKYKEVKNGIVQNVKGHECNLDIDCEE